MTGSDKQEFRIGGAPCELTIRELGDLVVTSGQVEIGDVMELGSSDPLSATIKVDLPNGRYPMHAVLAGYLRNGRQSSVHAFLTLVAGTNPTASTEAITRPHALDLFEDVINVEAGLVGFADAQAVADRSEDQFEEFYHGDVVGVAPHFAPHANLALPWRADRGRENLIYCMSGWGDGSYAAATTRDAAGQLTGVHVNFDVFDGVDSSYRDWAPFDDLREAVSAYLRDPQLALQELGAVVELDAVLGFTLERQTRQQDWGEQLVQEIAVTDGRRVIMWIGEDTVTGDGDDEPGAPLLSTEIRVFPLSSLVDLSLEVKHRSTGAERTVHSVELRLFTAVPDYLSARDQDRTDIYSEQLFFMKSWRNGGPAQAERLAQFGRLVAGQI